MNITEQRKELNRNANNYRGFTLVSKPNDDSYLTAEVYDWECDTCHSLTSTGKLDFPHIYCSKCKKSNSAMFDDVLDFISYAARALTCAQEICSSVYGTYEEGHHYEGLDYDFYVDYYCPEMEVSIDFIEFDPKKALAHKNRQHIKALELRVLGIQHITIYDHQWLNARDAVQTLLMRTMELVEYKNKKVDEHNSIKLLNPLNARMFLLKNSFKQFNADLYYGFYDFDELVAVLPVLKVNDTSLLIYELVWFADYFFIDAFQEMISYIELYNLPQSIKYQMDISDMHNLEFNYLVQAENRFNDIELADIINPKMWLVNKSPYTLVDIPKGTKQQLISENGFSPRLSTASMLVKTGKTVTMDSGKLIYDII